MEPRNSPFRERHLDEMSTELALLTAIHDLWRSNTSVKLYGVIENHQSSLARRSLHMVEASSNTYPVPGHNP